MHIPIIHLLSLAFVFLGVVRSYHSKIMEPHPQQQHQAGMNNVGGCGGGGGGGGGSAGKAGGGSCHCRPTCPRWTPTTDQIRILKELYHNNGVRSPTAEQIQKISARLRQYGKIEGKNVFYWFQNYKARERLKKKIEGNTTTTTPTPTTITTADHRHRHLPMHQRPHPSPPTHHRRKPAEDFATKSHPHSITSGAGYAPAPSPSYATVYTVGQMGEHGYGPVIMEKSFRDCSISSTSSSSVIGRNYSWVGIDPHTSSYIFFGPKKSEEEEEDRDIQEDEEEEEEEEEEENGPGIETLPLFPMHGEEGNFNYNNIPFTNSSNAYWYASNNGSTTSSSSSSLELSLNSHSTSRSSGSL